MQLSEKELKNHMDELTKMANEFNKLFDRKEFERARWILLKAQIVAEYLKLPKQALSELFGYWPDDGDNKTVPPPGLFDREMARKVDWYCCVKQHKSYQDIANRKNGVPPQYYSDTEYCSIKCHQALWNNTRTISEILQ